MDLEEACTFARQWSAHIAWKARLAAPTQPSGVDTSVGPPPGGPATWSCDCSALRESDS